jgi:RecA/RadA recombinase
LSEFKNASEVLEEKLSHPRLSTGSADLDSLIGGGIEKGLSYLFYGDEESGVDLLIHRIVVNSLLPTERFGLGGKCAYIYCGNYRREKTMLDTRLLTYLIKAERMDPMKALDNIYVICSFSEDQQEQVFEDLLSLLERDPEIKLVVVHNIAKLFTPSEGERNVRDRIMRLQKVIHQIWRACAENGLALVVSCRPFKSGSHRIPKPEGGKYLKHRASVIVYFRRKMRNSVSAFLIKHPNRPPRMIRIKLSEGGDLLGRITHPFRSLLQEEIDNLKRTYREALMDAKRREAFDSLVHTWSGEQGAMSYARVPTVLDVMLLTAAVDNRKLIEEALEQIKTLRSKLEEIDASLRKLLE